MIDEGRQCIMGHMQNNELEKILSKIYKERVTSNLQWDLDQCLIDTKDSQRARKARKLAGTGFVSILRESPMLVQASLAELE